MYDQSDISSACRAHYRLGKSYHLRQQEMEVSYRDQLFGGGGGIEMVSIATAGDLIVVSCAPGWTEEDWDAAIAAAQISTNAYFDAEEIEADGTEILYFTTARAEVSVA